MPSVIRAEETLTLPFEPDALWPYVADTNRIDRAVGLPEARFVRIERKEGGEEAHGEYIAFGVPVARWIEHPFEWERPRWFAVLREYQWGPLTRFYGGTELQPVEGGTRLRIFAELTPRSPLLDPFLRYYVAPQGVQRAARQYHAAAAFLQRRANTPFPALLEMRSPVDQQRLGVLIAQIQAQGAPEELIARLRQHVVEAPDEDVYGMRPLELASGWDTDWRDTLEAFLRGTVAGLTEMRWELLCPSCRGVKADAAHLGDLASEAHCSACNTRVLADADQAIEARFYPAPTVRAVDLGVYCVGGPMSTPHRLAQVVLAPGQTVEWQLTLAPGSYVIRSPQSRGAVRLRAEEGGPERLEVSMESLLMLPEQADLASGAARVRLLNETSNRVTVWLDDARWTEAAATPGRLMALPAFRQLFSAEALAPGVELAISRVGLLFSDLAGSTALYEQIGEARAFRLVSEHFGILRPTIEAHGGAVIKTIGDAVMGAFPDGRSAMAAGIAIQREIRGLDCRGAADPARFVKVGVHAGPCYAVTLNGQLDYFGTAVNIAARVQHEARGGEVVVTEPVFEEAGALVTGAGLEAEPFRVTLKGITEPMLVYRVDCVTGVTAAPEKS